jgi:hypothetical protein
MAAVLVFAVAGCGSQGHLDTNRASTAGVACQLVEYDVVSSALGVRFDTADAAQVDGTYSCVLSQAGRSFPELVVAFSPSQASAVIFRSTVTPSGATAVQNLGRGAYQLALNPAAGADGAPGGPGVQVGWLSAAPQIMMLRYTWPAEATADDITGLTAKLLDFARAVEAEITSAPATATAGSTTAAG